MPTIKRIGRFRVVVYPNDHRPAHVHIIGSDSEAVFDLNCPVGPPELRENYGFSLKALGKIKSELDEDLAFFCSEWSRIHGHP
ncbi:MAG TPA: DUF4160 domain-containing protein [Burkholderiales bacterium]|nr:DUF4160 domain-containing protein [Burkholderiales bacterium]